MDAERELAFIFSQLQDLIRRRDEFLKTLSDRSLPPDRRRDIRKKMISLGYERKIVLQMTSVTDNALKGESLAHAVGKMSKEMDRGFEDVEDILTEYTHRIYYPDDQKSRL